MNDKQIAIIKTLLRLDDETFENIANSTGMTIDELEQELKNMLTIK